MTLLKLTKQELYLMTHSKLPNQAINTIVSPPFRNSDMYALALIGKNISPFLFRNIITVITCPNEDEQKKKWIIF